MKSNELQYNSVGVIIPASLRQAAKYIIENTPLAQICEHYGERMEKLKAYHTDNLKQAYETELFNKFKAEETICLDRETARVKSFEISATNSEFWGTDEEFIYWNTQHNNRRTVKVKLDLINKVYCTTRQGAYLETEIQ